MSTLEQVKANVLFAADDHVNSLTAEDLQLYDQAKRFYHSKTKVSCSQCGYCQPCKQKIPISFIRYLLNDACMYDAVKESSWAYRVFIKPESRGDQCTECGECEEKCPQKIPVSELLKEAHELLK